MFNNLFTSTIKKFTKICDRLDIPYEFNDELVEGKVFLFIHVNKDSVKKLNIECKNPDTVDEWVDFNEIISEMISKVSLEILQNKR